LTIVVVVVSFAGERAVVMARKEPTVEKAL
jgi:hypothetical protein